MLLASRLNKLIVLSVLFFAGWFLCRWLHTQASDSGWFWIIVSIFALTAATLIEGSWRIMPIMVMGFCIAEVGAWTLFYSGNWYYPQSDDVLWLTAVGCDVATLVGTSRLIRSRRRLLTNPPAGKTGWIPVLCFGGALFFAGAFACGLSLFAMDRFAPEPAAFACALLCSAGIWIAASVI